MTSAPRIYVCFSVNNQLFFYFFVKIGGVSRQVPRRGHRIIRTSSVRGRSGSSSVTTPSGTIMSSSRPPMYVPEELILQVTNVLEGKIGKTNLKKI